MRVVSDAKLVEYTKEITVAVLSNAGKSVNAETAKQIADFMQVIHSKLTELAEED